MAPASGAGTTDENRPLVSVVVPSYRHERYVEYVLDSCVGNGYPNVELVIANDGSPEADDEKIKAWLARHPDVPAQYIHHTSNRGLTRTFNECLSKCSGAYIAILAADDVLLPGSLEKRVSYLEKRPDKLAVFSDCEVIDGDGKVLFDSGIEGLYGWKNMQRRALRDERLLPLEIVFHWAVPGPVFMARREAYDLVGNYDETLTMEDWDMYLRLASTGRLGYLDESTAQYRWHGSNVVKREDPQRAAEVWSVAARAARRFRGIARVYLTAYGAMKPLDPNLPWGPRTRGKLVRYFTQYCARTYRLYRGHALARPTSMSQAD